MKNTKDTGERSEAMIMAALLACGKTVLRPWGDNQRYDLVIDDSGQFKRIQCKTAQLSDDGSYLTFRTCSTVYGGGMRDYKCDVEFFGVYCPKLDKAYLVPVADVPSTLGTLRFDEPKNGQTKLVKYAVSYQIWPPKMPH